jgi:hypothetical protein
MTFLTSLTRLSFLIDPAFWSRIGFLLSYIATSLIALEVFRLVYTDANKRDLEKWLAQYNAPRAESPRRRKVVADTKQELISVSIEALERSVSPVRAAVAPEERPRRTPEAEKLRRRAPSASSQHINPLKERTSSNERTSSPTPLRRLRKRSDTLNSTGSSESRRRHREASPASEAGSSRTRTRSREEREKKTGLGLGLGKLMRGKV